jgi:hypothetical protein
VLVGLAIPAEAREGSGGVVVDHFGATTAGGPAPRISAPERSVNGSLPNRGSRNFVVDRSSGHVVARDHRDFDRSGHPRRLLAGVDGFIGSPVIDDTAPPSVVDLPQLAPESEQPGRSQVAGDLPPCHETTSIGIIIERGMACSRAPR